MKKSTKVILLSSLLLIFVGLTVTFIASWLTDTSETDEVTFKVGNVTFAWSGEMIPAEDNDILIPIVPGQNLVKTTFNLNNSSTVSTELRVKIIVTSVFLGGDATDYVLLTLGTGWVNDNGYWYYRGTDTSQISEDGVTKYKIASTIKTITVLPGVALNGNNVGNTFKDDIFTIQLLFEAKQSDYVTWEYLGTTNIDFNKGTV